VDVIVFAIHLREVRLEVAAHGSQDLSEPFGGGSIEHPVAVPGHEQVHVQAEDALPVVDVRQDGSRISVPAVVGRVYCSLMRLLKAYRFRLEPTPTVAWEMGRVAGCCRFAFNRALALEKERYQSENKHLGYAALCKELTCWRHAPGMEFLAAAPIHALQQALRDLDRAYRNFFEGRADLPRFKKKGRHDAFRYPDPKQFAVDDRHGRVKLPKLGWVRYRRSRSVSGTPKQLTISREAGHWFVSIQTEQEVATPVHPANTAVGVDVGVVKFAALSSGVTFAPVSSYRKYKKKLAREQRALARKKKYSNNWRKQKARVGRLYMKIARTRNDFLHKTSTAISKTHALVVLEDLSVKSMSRSARGTVNAPGRNVRAKAGLNRSILDQGWAEFRRQLEYKQTWRGGLVVVIDPRNTSRTCPCCGHVSAENRKTRAVFQCVRCGHAADADMNAARNILAAGLRRDRLGDTKSALGLPAQEPTRVGGGVSCLSAGISGLSDRRGCQ
jgi:putative transposase